MLTPSLCTMLINFCLQRANGFCLFPVTCWSFLHFRTHYTFISDIKYVDALLNSVKYRMQSHYFQLLLFFLCSRILMLLCLLYKTEHIGILKSIMSSVYLSVHWTDTDTDTDNGCTYVWYFFFFRCHNFNLWIFWPSQHIISTYCNPGCS
jgi:hypothetical protein